MQPSDAEGVGGIGRRPLIPKQASQVYKSALAPSIPQWHWQWVSLMFPWFMSRAPHTGTNAIGIRVDAQLPIPLASEWMHTQCTSVTACWLHQVGLPGALRNYKV